MTPDTKEMAAKILSRFEKADNPEPEPPDVGLETASEELIAAAKTGDAKAVAAALRSAYAMLRSEPEDES